VKTSIVSGFGCGAPSNNDRNRTPHSPPQHKASQGNAQLLAEEVEKIGFTNAANLSKFGGRNPSDWEFA
jgi:hypothetical protein